MIAVNFFTGLLLIKIGRIKESLNFFEIAEKMIQKLIEKDKTIYEEV